MALVTAARGGAKQATAVIGGAFVAAGKPSALPGLVVFDGVGALRRTAAGSGGSAYVGGVRGFSRAGHGSPSSARVPWLRVYPRAGPVDARLAVVCRRVILPYRLVQMRQFSRKGDDGNDPNALQQFLERMYGAVRAYFCRVLSSGKMDFLDREAVKAWIFKVENFGSDVLKYLKNVFVGTSRTASVWFLQIEDCGKDFLLSMTKFVIRNLAAADAWVSKFEDHVKEFLVRIWMFLNSSIKRKTMDISGPVPSPPRSFVKLLKGVWLKVHAIERIMQEPASKTRFHEILELVFDEKVADAVYKFLNSCVIAFEKLYAMGWKLFAGFSGVLSYWELELTPMATYRLAMNWLSAMYKDNVAYLARFKDPIDQAGSTEEKSPKNVEPVKVLVVLLKTPSVDNEAEALIDNGGALPVDTTHPVKRTPVTNDDMPKAGGAFVCTCRQKFDSQNGPHGRGTQG